MTPSLVSLGPFFPGGQPTSLVERMLELNKRSPRTPQEQKMVKREIESTDRAIDNLVDELYGLNEEEIKNVEGTA